MLQLNTQNQPSVSAARLALLRNTSPVLTRFGTSSSKAHSSQTDSFQTSAPMNVVAVAMAGGQPTGGLTNADLKPYQDVLQPLPELKPYKLDLLRSYRLFSTQTKAQVEKILSQVKPQDIRILYDNKYLGAAEESGDTFFELYTLNAMRHKIITSENVNRWINEYQKEKGLLPFSFFMKRVVDMLEPKQVEWFQKMVGLSDAKSRELLGLMCVKFTLFKMHDPKFDIWKDTKPLLKGEAAELNEHLPWYSPDRLKMWFLARLYTHIPFLPVSFYKNQVVKIVQKRLQIPIQYEHLMEGVQDKQRRRQELTFEQYDSLPSYKERKGAVKGYELLKEASILKEIGIPKLQLQG